MCAWGEIDMSLVLALVFFLGLFGVSFAIFSIKFIALLLLRACQTARSKCCFAFSGGGQPNPLSSDWFRSGVVLFR